MINFLVRNEVFFNLKQTNKDEFDSFEIFK